MAGALTVADARRAGAPIDYYSVLPGDSVILVLEMTSADLDPFLYLFRETGETIAQAFHSTGEPELETVMLRQPVGAGCYLVGASAWDETSTGSYTLTATIEPLP